MKSVQRLLFPDEIGRIHVSSCEETAFSGNAAPVVAMVAGLEQEEVVFLRESDTPQQ